MEFGKSLREAREAKGYTISQIAEMTHLKTAAVEGLEREDFSMIAAPIYGRGFVKLYCEAVGLEAKPFVDEFMEIMNGNREVTIRERPVPEPAPVAEPEPPVTPPPLPVPEPAAERDLFTQEPAVAEQPAPAPAAEPLPATEAKADISRYASPFRTAERPPVAFPVLPWRLILLGVAALAFLAILVCGIRALYRATSAQPVTESTPTETAKPVATAPAEQSATKPVARTQQQSIPALYID